MPTVDLQLVPIVPGKPDVVARLTLNRPEVSNAFNGAMIDELLQHLDTIEKKGLACRAVVVRGAGKHFSGGADLEWMKQSAHLSYDANLKDAERLSALFARLYRLDCPTIGVVQGAAYGGAVGLAACCDWVIAVDSARFCLSEVKVGLVAAVILPYLSTRMLPGDLRRLVMTAAVFGAAEARAAGLVQRVATAETVDAVLREDLVQVLAGEPTIQRVFKRNHRSLLEGEPRTWKGNESIGVETIAKARVSATGQEGIEAFLAKRPPEWVVALPEGWKLG